MRKPPFVKDRLYCPGPTPVPTSASVAAMYSNVYHRTDSFREVFLECRRLLHPFFRTSQEPIILTSSGTGALEAAIVNLTKAGDHVLVVSGGKFGERWEKLAETYQCNVKTYRVPWGESPDLDTLRDHLKSMPNCGAVFFQSNETSTGVAFPVREIANIVRATAPETLIVVDAISGLVAHFMDMDSWSIDCVVSGSQKGFGIPPGLSFISLSNRAWDKISSRPKFYFDLLKEKNGQEKGETAWTPATSLIQSLVPALRSLSELGPEACDQHHRKLAVACRLGVEAIGLSLFPKSHPSQALTAVSLPDSIDGSKLLKTCREKYGAIFAGGQDHLKGKILRISHLGFIDEMDLISGLNAFEMGLASMGYKHTLGSATGAAMKSLLDSELP